ncbi:cytochrome P450 [Amycolatopsis sp. NPDC059027]|uniref:cytochrome P450 n=1 Tax=Amycolatopsis sp. NPDC059027 TaxID=3346709 RepID=UPI00366C067F
MDDFFVLDARADRVGALRDPRLSSDPDSGATGQANLLLMDGADHRRLREVVKEIIALVEPLPSAVRSDIEDVVAGLAMSVSFDLVADFARPVAARVTSAVLGAVEPLDARLLTALSETAANLDVWSGGAPPGADLAALRVAMFFLKATAVEGGGLALLREAHDAGRVTEDELMLTPVMLAHAAYENSMNFLALAGLDLLRRPRQPDEVEVRRLVQEIAPTRYAARRVTGPLTVSAVTFEKGDKLAVPLGDGLAFGLGRHACPGSRVAVAEGEVALRALSAVLTSSHVVGEVRYKPHRVFHGLEYAQVTRTSPAAERV